MTSEDSTAVQFDDSPPTTQPGPAVEVESPLRYDDEGKPVYAEGEEGDGLAVDPQTPQDIRDEVARQWNEYREWAKDRQFTQDSLLEGVEKIYSTTGAAKFFGRSTQWIYWGLREDPKTGEQIFTFKNGEPIRPERVGKMGKRRFSLPIIREIALSCFRRGQFTEEELEATMARILIAEFGRKAFSAE
jgi:hypothetical protein